MGLFMGFPFPAKGETYHCNSLYLEEPMPPIINKGEGSLAVGCHSPPPTHTHSLPDTPILVSPAQLQVESSFQKKKKNPN